MLITEDSNRDTIRPEQDTIPPEQDTIPPEEEKQNISEQTEQ